MPIYEYTCPDCGRTFDKIRTFSQADDPIPCPACQEVNAKRILSTFNCSNSSSSSSRSSSGCGSCSGGSCATCH